MNVNEEDFQTRLYEIGKLYEDGKDCLNSLSILEDEWAEYNKLFEIIRELRDIASVAVKQAYQLKEN
jgi:hypothetical protein